MRKRISEAVSRADQHTRDSLLMVTLITAANFLNYLYQLVMGRLLVPAEYGALLALIALWNVVFLSCTSVGTAVARRTAQLHAKRKGAGRFVGSVLKSMIALGAVLAIVLLAASPLIGGFLKINDLSLLAVIFIPLPFVFALPVLQGALQGSKRFAGLGISNIGFSLVKLSLGAALVYIGLGIFGGLMGFSAAGVVMAFATYLLVKDIDLGARISMHGIGKFSLFMLVVGSLYAAAANLDMILAKHFFTDEAAGLYASIAVLGKIILLAPIGLSMALFPKVVQERESKKDPRPSLARSLVLLLLVCGPILAAYFLFPEFVISLLFGDDYTPAAPFLGRYGLVMISLAGIGLIVNYMAPQHKKEIAWLLAALIAGQACAAFLFHEGIAQLIDALAAVNVSGLVVCAIAAVRKP